MVKTAENVRMRLKMEGVNATLVNARFAKPLDEEMILYLTRNHKIIVTCEENVASGGFGERVREFLDKEGSDVNLLTVSIPDEYVEHGNVELLKKEIGIDEDTIFNKIMSAYGRLNR